MNDSCVLLFSGGRDSTLAAVRLAKSGKKLILVTVTSEHLNGISAVKQRLIELKGFLSKNIRWISLPDSNINVPLLNLSTKTCLPCFLKYTSLGVIIAQKLNISSISFGFTKYQSGWPEQTPMAIDIFRRTLSQFGIDLEIPVYNIISKEKAIEELKSLGFNSSALEQKCSRQVMNENLPPNILDKALCEWAKALYLTISTNLKLNLILTETQKLNNFSNHP